MTETIVRTETYASGGITPEEEVQLKAHSEAWIKIALRTETINPELITDALKRLYRVSELKEPRVVIVRSPLEMAVAGGISAALLHAKKENPALIETTNLFKNQPNNCSHPLFVAVNQATDGGVSGLDGGKLDEIMTELNMEQPGCYLPVVSFFADGNKELETVVKECIKAWWRPYQGGNFWASWCSYLTAFRDVIGLKLPEYEEKLPAWEDSAKQGSYRWMHEDFCMVSDFPEEIHLDTENRPSNENGPSHRWRDGWELFYWHGMALDLAHKKIVLDPSSITVDEIENETNIELRRVMVERYGLERYLTDSHAEELHSDEFGVLYRKDQGEDEAIVVVKVVNSTPEPDGTRRIYFLRVPPDTTTAKEGVAWSFGLTEKEYAIAAET